MCEWSSDFAMYQTYIAQCVCMCACKDAICLSALTSQGWENSLMLWLVLTEPALGMMSIAPFLVISPFKATSACVPKPAQNFLSFFVMTGLFLEDTGCVKSEHGCGRVGVLLPSISILRQLSILCPFSHAWWNEVRESNHKWFSQDFKDTLLCLRSAKGECSDTFLFSAKTHRFSYLAVLFKTVVLWICLAEGQTLWYSTEWLTGQPGDEESASSLPLPPCTPLSLQDPDKIPLLTHIKQLHCLIWSWLHLNSQPSQIGLSETGPWNEKHVFKKLGWIFLLGKQFEKTTVFWTWCFNLWRFKT